MSHIDPDALVGAMTDLNTAIADNSTALTAKGFTPATLQTRLKAMQDGLSGKKGARDKKKSELATAQTEYTDAATNCYSDFSDLVDTVAGGLGKKTPEGARVLEYRKHINASPTHRANPSTDPSTPAK